MDNQTKKLISFSDAARLRDVTPQTIDDYVKRKRLKVEIKDEKKFLDREEVENLKVGKSGRPSKKQERKILTKIEDAQRKLENPNQYLDSFFRVLLRVRPLYKEFGNGESVQHFRSKIVRANKIKFRLKFRNYERVYKPTTLLNNEVIREMVYANPKVQMFFEYVFYSSAIKSEGFDIEREFINFSSEFSREFSWLWGELKQKYGLGEREKTQDTQSLSKELVLNELKNIPIIQEQIRIGRPISFIDKKGNVKNVKKEISEAIRLWNEGKSGRQILDKLFPMENYKHHRNDRERRKDFNRLKANLRHHQNKHPEFFNRIFDASLFARNVWNPKIVEN